MTIVGPIGIALSNVLGGDRAATVATAVELEELGYGTVWLPGGQGNNLPLITEVVRGTTSLTVASAILSVDRVPADQVAAAYADLEAAHPGRFVVGLGGAHGPRPLPTLNAYLDVLDTTPPVVPAPARILAALGPRMLALARDRAAGAYPYLVSPDYVTQARPVLGPDRTLAVLLTVVPETDPALARGAAREAIRFLTTVPGYARNLVRMGLSDRDVAEVSDRLVDTVTVWGDLDAIIKRIEEYRSAGADHLVLSFHDTAGGDAATWWRRLAEAG